MLLSDPCFCHDSGVTTVLRLRQWLVFTLGFLQNQIVLKKKKTELMKGKSIDASVSLVLNGNNEVNLYTRNAIIVLLLPGVYL